MGLQKYSVGRVPLAIIHSIIADEHGAQQQCNSTSFILDYFSFFFLINQTVRVRRYTIGGNSHTVRTLPGYVLVCGGRRGGWHAVLSCMWRYSHMLFHPAFGVIPTCVFFSHMCNLFPSYHSCHCTIHAFVPSLSRSIPACSWSQRGEGCVCGPACYMRQKYTKKVV
mgnify:CR=1 FL=1